MWHTTSFDNDKLWEHVSHHVAPQIFVTVTVVPPDWNSRYEKELRREGVTEYFTRMVHGPKVDVSKGWVSGK